MATPVVTPPLAPSATTTITCTACRLTVTGAAERRDHYRSDFHRVNLKRKVTGIGPLTPTEFSTRVNQLELAKQNTAESTGRRARRATVAFCQPCCKRFSSPSALANHEASRRHRDTVRRLARDSDKPISDVSTSLRDDSDAGDSDGHVVHLSERDGDDVTRSAPQWSHSDDDEDDEKLAEEELEAELGRRLNSWDAVHAHRRSAFDGSLHENAEHALLYMARTSGLFIPFRERLTDADGLVRYLVQKVEVGYACVACDKGFASAEDARRHMHDVGHCRLAEDLEIFLEEFEEYYDFSGKTKTEDDEGWEEVDGEDVMVDEDSSKESGAVIVADDGTKDEVEVDPRVVMSALDVGDEDDGREDSVALYLGGGKIVGHRSLANYYKQAGGRRAEDRVAVLANRGGNQLQVASLRKASGFDVHSSLGKATMRAKRRQQRFELLVGQQNYYVRKSRFKQSFAVFNSGYRA